MISVPGIQQTLVQQLVARIATGTEPLYVKHQPLAGKPLKECFSIVAEQVEAHGGERVCGWAILQLDGIWLEAEFHAVWCDQTGQLLDVTPRELPFREYLFLPDPARAHEGVQVESHFLPLTTHPCVCRYIELAHELFIETNRGELAYATNFSMTPRIADIKAEMEYVLKDFPWPRQ
jgi:hypothetical protein